MDPIASALSWDSASTDNAAAYVGLLHAEAESTLENAVRLLLRNAQAKSQAFKADPVLLNCVGYYNHQLNTKIARLTMIPKRGDLETDATKLIHCWTSLGAAEYFESLIANNHGVGLQYVERLFHPLGIVVSDKNFKRLSSAGVREVATLVGSTTMLTEFALMRGTAVHAGTSEFRGRIQAESPSAILTRGQGAVRFVEELCQTLARRVW
ncbi:hypothetical protein ISU07_16315 [Nocardioides islandensis]|uniref:RiboL-PSP-HEPN domain-containing protein n=1 Tax=Nocardioides islandensis TaxID=433663 RepID=A0A930YFA1_9ACTN|nr:hypothetical protein [Nocardioides islandensis]MBF4764697.1 hypothetical protein [Nocardioides islandensis]